MPALELDSTYRALSRALVLMIDQSVAVTRIAGETLGPDGVTNRDLNILLTVRGQPGLTPSGLAKRLGISRSLVSHSLRRFQHGGLVRRDVNPSDHRVFRLTLTTKGRRCVDSFEARLGDWFASILPQSRELLERLDPASQSQAQPPGDTPPLEVAQHLAAAGSAYAAEITPLMEPFGITLAVDRFAVTLIEHHQQMRPARLAGALDLTPSGTSTLLDRLQAASLIERAHANPDDRREVILSLTPTGQQAAALAIEVLHRHAPSLREAIRTTTRVRPTTSAA